MALRGWVQRKKDSSSYHFISGAQGCSGLADNEDDDGQKNVEKMSIARTMTERVRVQGAASPLQKTRNMRRPRKRACTHANANAHLSARQRLHHRYLVHPYEYEWRIVAAAVPGRGFFCLKQLYILRTRYTMMKITTL